MAIYFDASLRSLRLCGAAHAGVVLEALQAVKTAASAAAAARDSGIALPDAIEACRLVSSFLVHPAEDVCTSACLALPPVQALLQPGLLAEHAEATTLSKDVFIRLLMQLGYSRASLRLAALEAIERLRHWDPEVFVRSVKIPGFTKVTDAEAAGEQGRDGPERERWHGALYFALDDELPAVRVAALVALRSGVNRSDLRRCRALDGVFQRVAAVSTLCLIDDDGAVRGAAADTLVSAMRTRKVALISPTKGTKATADTVDVAKVLQALSVDPAVVLRILEAALFTDRQALEVAVAALLALDDRAPAPSGEASEERLRAALARLGRAHASMLEPGGGLGCVDRIPGAGRCRGLGHRLFTQMVEASETSGASMSEESFDLGTGALHLSSTRFERLRALLRAAAAVRPALGTCVPGLDAPAVASSNAQEAAEDCLRRWAAHLGHCYARLRSAAAPRPAPEPGASAAGVLPGRGARRGLRHLHRACSAAAAAGDPQPGPGGLAGNLRALASWAELLLGASEALADMEASGSQEAAVARAAQMHVATSFLMHGFEWGATPGDFPRVLLAFRLLSLRLMAVGSALGDDLRTASIALGASANEAAEVCQRPLHDFLPCLPEDYFTELFGPSSRVMAHRGCVRSVADASRPSEGVQQGTILPLRFVASLGGALRAEVESTLPKGAFLRVSYPRAGPRGEQHLSTGSAVPDADGVLRTCVVPLDFPWEATDANMVVTLQLVLRVDACATDSSGAVQIECGATGVEESHPMYRQLNELQLGPLEEVPFTVLPALVAREESH